MSAEVLMATPCACVGVCDVYYFIRCGGELWGLKLMMWGRTVDDHHGR